MGGRSIRRLGGAATATVLLAATLVVHGSAVGAAQSPSVPPPSPTEWFQLGGATIDSSGGIQLADGGGGEARAAYWDTTIHPAALTASFDETIGSGFATADGLAFVLLDADQHSIPAVGDGGGALGFGPLRGLAITLTQNERPWGCYPSTHFVGITDGQEPPDCPLNYLHKEDSIPTLVDATHAIRVAVTWGSSPGVTVSIDGTKYIDYPIPFSLPPNVFVGFTAGTGFGTETALIQNVNISYAMPSLSVRGRVVEGRSQQQTSNTTRWVADFADARKPSDAANFSANVAWGDHRESIGTVVSVDQSVCKDSGAGGGGKCYAVDARHKYKFDGVYQILVTVTATDGRSDSVRSIAEIGDPAFTPDPAKATGVLTYLDKDGAIQGCTGEALAGLNVVLTAAHCVVGGHGWEFAPQHSGDCAVAFHKLVEQVHECEAAGRGHDPLGYWTGVAAYIDRAGGPATDDAYILVDPVGSLGLVLADQQGLPVAFNPARGQQWTSYGYPVYAGDWSLESCTGTDVSTSGHLMMSCPDAFNHPATKDNRSGPTGISGGPWVNGSILPGGIGSVNRRYCPTWEYIVHGLTCPDRPPGDQTRTLYGSDVGNGSMQAYLSAALASLNS
jgi:hypothetical protein